MSIKKTKQRKLQIVVVLCTKKIKNGLRVEQKAIKIIVWPIKATHVLSVPRNTHNWNKREKNC